ncbi:hypothetical protein BBQ_3538 [Burkholderia pseudomallei MSHR511]|nr:hypothetical protein BBQ_3538 [Burkholderia pseudomallei MSHR511]
MRQAAAQEAREHRAQRVLDEQHGRQPHVLLAQHRVLRADEQRVREARFEAWIRAGGERLRQHALEVRVEPHHLHLARARIPLLRDRAAERKTHGGREIVRIGDAARLLGHGFDDRAHVADRHAFVEQVLQHFLQRRERDRLRHQILDERRRVLAGPLDERLHFLPAEQLGRVLDDEMVQVRRDDGARVDDRVAVHLRLLAQRRVDPHGGQPERRVLRRRAGQRGRHLARIDREPLARIRFARADFDALERDPVSVRAQLEVVADVNDGRQEADFLRELLADALDPLEQFAVGVLVDERNQPVADFEAERIDQRHVFPRRLVAVGRQRGGRRDLRDHARRLLRGLALGHRARQPDRAAAEQQKREVRHVRDEPHQHDDRACDHQHARVREELRGELRADVLVGRHARDDHAGRGRDHERRDLRDEAVADREQRVVLARRGEAHVVLGHPDDEAADHVDRHDDQARDRVAAHELRRAVHRAVELRFLRDRLAALLRLLFVDEAGVQIGVDRHLLAGHRVEREARGHFGDPARALRDHHEVDDHQDHEHDDADREVAADEEVAERLDHLAGRVRARVAFEQHDAGGRDVQRQAQKRREQQHARERGEIERLHRVHADEQHHHRQRDVEREEQIEQQRRQRQDHHPQNHADEDRARERAQVRAREQLRALAEESGRHVHAAPPAARPPSASSASSRSSCGATCAPLSSSAGTSRSTGVSGAIPPSARKRLS